MTQKQYSIDELPAKIRITTPNGGNPLGSLLTPLGAVIAVTGGLFILFGPDVIYYDRSEGMSFVQILQAYPGPIATVGFVLMTLGGYLKNQSANQRLQAIQKQIDAQLAFSMDDVPEGRQLYINPLSDDYYEVGLAEVEQAETA